MFASLVAAAVLAAPTIASAQQSPPDPAPPPPVPAISRGIVEQAGIGSTRGYAHAGVVELGGSAGFAAAPSFSQLVISPTAGWFFLDRLELSAIVNISYVNAGAGGTAFFNALVEPSYHHPIAERLLVFGGVGAGLGYAKAGGAGFALAPRVGLNVLVGRSGVLTPAFNVSYTTNETVQTRDGTLLAASVGYGASAGYTVLW